MLKHNTAYRITVFNVQTICNISGLTKETLLANLGWYAIYSETRQPRWALVPRSIVDDNPIFDIEEDAWHND